MEHEEPNDQILETTAYRELKEETGYPTREQENDRIILNNFVNTPFSFAEGPHWAEYRMHKIQRFYYYPNFVHEINQNYKDEYEINGNVWVKIRSLINYFAGPRMNRNYQPNDEVRFTDDRLNVVPYRRGFTVATSVQNFFIRQSNLRDSVLEL